MEDAAKETVIIVHGTWAAPPCSKATCSARISLLDRVVQMLAATLGIGLGSNPCPKKSDAPTSVVPSWYQIHSEGQNRPNFVSKLNKALEQRGSPARCWAHCKDNSEIYSWSGENAWIDRTRAALSLAAHINKLQADGWRCHVVAHSHGGNVIAEALPAVIQTADNAAGLTGTITTLGTPFIDAMSPVAERIARRRTVLQILIGSCYLFVVLSLVTDILKPSLYSEYSPLILAALVLLPVVVYFWPRGKKKIGWRDYWNAFANPDPFRPFIFSMSSPMDEAWQLLHHMREIPNPLAPKTGPILYLWDSRMAYIRRSCEVARIQGVALFPDQTIPVQVAVVAMWLLPLLATWLLFLGDPDVPWLTMRAIFVALILVLWFVILTSLAVIFGTRFLSGMASPLRWVGRQLRATLRIFNDITTYMVRRRSWSLFQEMAIGLDGYSFELPEVERAPTFAPSTIYKYEDLPKSAEQRALAYREEWMKRAFGDVTKAFSKMAAPDVESLLKMIETDLSLVHAAYYTDDECIDRIADWIAGKTLSTETENAKGLITPSA